jgi:hypothetical protein
LKPNTPYKLAWVPDGAPIPELMVVPLPMGPEQAIPDPDALTILRETDLSSYLEHLPVMSPEW